MIATVAWRPQAVVGAALAASALGAWRPTRGAGVVLGAVAAAGAAAVAHRMPVRRAAGGPGEPVTVLSANVFTGRADTGLLAALIEREEPDFVVLPEAGCDFRDKLLPLVAHLGYRGWAATPPGVSDIMGVVLLAGPRAGRLQVQRGYRPALPPRPGDRRCSRRAHAVRGAHHRAPQPAARRPVAARPRRHRPLDPGDARADRGGRPQRDPGQRPAAGRTRWVRPGGTRVAGARGDLPVGVAAVVRDPDRPRARAGGHDDRRRRRARRRGVRPPGRGRAAGAARAVAWPNVDGLDMGGGAARPSGTAPPPTDRDAVVARRTQGRALIHLVADFSASIRGSCPAGGSPRPHGSARDPVPSAS